VRPALETTAGKLFDRRIEPPVHETAFEGTRFAVLNLPGRRIERRMPPGRTIARPTSLHRMRQTTTELPAKRRFGHPMHESTTERPEIAPVDRLGR
jgi:hypothetical protein